MISPFKVCNSLVFNIFTELCNHHYSQFCHIFTTLEGNPVFITLCSPPPPKPMTTISMLSVSAFVCSGRLMEGVAPCLVSLTERHAFQVHPGRSKLIPCHGWVHVHWRRTAIVYLFASGWTPQLFTLFGYCE